jgi:hypothetical protein
MRRMRSLLLLPLLACGSVSMMTEDVGQKMGPPYLWNCMGYWSCPNADGGAQADGGLHYEVNIHYEFATCQETEVAANDQRHERAPSKYFCGAGGYCVKSSDAWCDADGG